MSVVSYRQVSQEHIDFVGAKLDYILTMEQDEFLKGVMAQLKDYYDMHFLKADQDYLNEVKRLIYSVGKNNQGTRKGKLIYEVYQKLKAGGVSPEGAMDQVGIILGGPDAE